MPATASAPELPQIKRKMPQRSPAAGKPVHPVEAEVEFVAAQVVRGMPIHLALSLANPLLTLPAWNDAISKSPKLARHYQLKVAEHVSATLDLLPGRKLRELPAEIWGLSRGVLREHFVEGKSGGSGNVTFNGPVQINSTRKAVKSLLRKVTMPPKELPEG